MMSESWLWIMGGHHMSIIYNPVTLSVDAPESDSNLARHPGQIPCYKNMS
jgi:hypothetical protein